MRAREKETVTLDAEREGEREACRQGPSAGSACHCVPFKGDEHLSPQTDSRPVFRFKLTTD